MKLKKVIVICGPTGVGKTDLSLKLAHHFKMEVISADSRQIYRKMDIGTGKVKKINRIVPHHLINIKNPDEKYTAGDFINDADEKIKEIIGRNNIPFIVGGTGFYIRSLVKGLSDIPSIPQSVRDELILETEKKGSNILYQSLRKIDPIAAENIHPNDGKKIIRALEVYKYTGIPISNFWNETDKKKRYINFTIYLTEKREKLYKKINQRVDAMFKVGLINEFEDLMRLGYNEEDPGMNTIGYKELFDYTNGNKSLLETIELIKQHMRNYAKRQFTWFSKSKIDLTIDVNNLTISDINNSICKFLGEAYAHC